MPVLAHPEVSNELVTKGEVEVRGVPPGDRVGVPLKADGRAFGVSVVQTYAEGEAHREPITTTTSLPSLWAAVASFWSRVNSTA